MNETRYTPDSLNQRDRISRGVIALLRTDPFFASIMLCQNIIEDDKANGLTVDGKTVRFNAEKLSALSDAQIQTMLAKGALRIALAQPFRFAGYDDLELLADNPISHNEVVELMNEAGGLAINSLLRGKSMPAGWKMPEDQGMDDNKPMEFYYDTLRAKYIPPPPNDDGQDGQGGDGGGKGDKETDGGQKPPTGETKGQDGDNGEGQDGQGNNPNPEPGQNGPTDARALPHPDADDPDKKDRAEQEWQSMVTQAAMQAEQAGKLPGYLKELVDRMMTPAQICWEEKLRRFAQKTIPRGSRTYARPNRRHSWNAAKIASSTPHGKSVKKGLVITDTSGSMDVESCNLGLSETGKVMSLYPEMELVHIQCDTRIADMQTFHPKRDKVAVDKLMRSPEWKGRGGTDMDPAFREAAKIKPQFIIIITDGYMTFPPKCAIPTFWLMTTDIKPPWGETAKLEKRHGKD